MKHARWLCLFLLMSLSAVSFAGDIQVSCEPALRIFLDGELMGISGLKDDGLFLMNVPRGAHTIRVEKDGFLPQNFEVDLLDLPIEVKVDEFTPEPHIPNETEPAGDSLKQLVGNLVVTSAPQNCVVEIDGKPRTKNTPQLALGGLTAGEHTISFSKPGYDRISSAITIKPGVDIAVRGDLKSGKVEFVNEGQGSLRLFTDPIGCTVRFLGKDRKKNSYRMNLSHIPAGEHPIEVSWQGLELSASVTIMAGKRTIVKVSFMKGDEPFVFSYEPEGRGGR